MVYYLDNIWFYSSCLVLLHLMVYIMLLYLGECNCGIVLGVKNYHSMISYHSVISMQPQD
jgi:hypothetical protein